MSTRIGLILLGAFFVFESILGCFSGKMYFKYGGWSAVEPVYVIKIFIIGLLFVSAGIFINKKIGKVINALIGLGLLIISIEIFTTGDPAGIQSKIGYPFLISGFSVLLISILFFYLAFRSEKSIKRYPKYMWCKDCFKFYLYEDVKDTDQICSYCGKKLTEYKNDGVYQQRNASEQSTKSPKPKKRKFKKR
ncbi:hypothetical protein [Campylobacter gracilis]|uniref:Uncharacterized protein n=1 Tax=Campylobacter gracilis RM3268 TaxID=553220 RepID=C8PF57_9BACT|nr:hypothetical protein [Campylobacter gracilis]AKT91767.1 putative membrane protein [Campylobacter gracilis]EEV18685.1 hypothetical protein CAMGR0001_2698 [Campylobacter gracilis RM3268]UEB46022.1 endonuclease Q family protein [Campylobacter gracilis]SUW77778.1 NADP-dependent malic enzyme (NADP-me) [Campylobacter gracilis]